MKRVIGIVSGKGGVGKTTIAFNLGYAFSKLGIKTTILDLNLTTSHLGLYAGLSHLSLTLNDLMREDIPVLEATYKLPIGLNIIPASYSLEDLVGINQEKISEIIEKIDSEIILLDSAPSLGKESLLTIRNSNYLLYVAMPNIVSLLDIVRVKKIADELEKESLGIIVNMRGKSKHELGNDEIESLTGLRVIQEIPFDDLIERANQIGKSIIEIDPYSKTSLSFLEIASKISGIEMPKISFWYRVFGRFLKPKF
ncbi:MAG: hypothetical protein B6U78_02570 [Candidatus Aenigmarchaeota archaeon ex4484_224]|nr:MAG: hypothetical protein B6U78_02570 [Candidatus Aenigmarchaeota archaeon ex4484_224]